MTASYTRFVLRTSLVKGALILFNLVAVASLFFIQVGAIMFIIPAAILDVIYILNGEGKWIIKQDAIKPAGKITSITFAIIVAILLIGAVALIYGVMNSG